MGRNSPVQLSRFEATRSVAAAFAVGATSVGVCVGAALTLPVFAEQTLPTQTNANMQDTAALTRDAYKLLQQRQYDRAIAQFQKCLMLNPRDWYCNYSLGLALKQSARPGALRYFERAFQFKDCFETAMELSLEYQQRKQFAKAVPLFEAILTRYPETIDRYNYNLSIGRMYAELRDTKSAVKYYEAAIALKPGEQEPYLHAARSCDWAGMRKDAIKFHKLFVATFPKSEETPKVLDRMKWLEWDQNREDITKAALNAEKTNPRDFEDLIEFQGSRATIAPKTVALIKQGLRTIPEVYRRRVKDEGIKVLITPTLINACPELVNVVPRGWSVHSSWDQAGGTFSPERNLIIIADKRRDAVSHKLVSDQDADRYLRHEFGHAYDYALGRHSNHRAENAPFSHGSKFSEAYFADVSRLNAKQREVLSYVLQDGNAGKEELFANLFESLYGNTSRPNTSEEILLTAFPSAAQLIRAQEKAFSHDTIPSVSIREH